ncbi:penicillin acylase family protein [Nocardioides euryhalodurans]|uniref:Penicillin acylase family protein n=1 Tax=Nocardioides euryhalodurans TaxID=2518370 RepID=A0A4P7GK97_9ACTN|nr:penicillin acylase family protein [Nocardioides euryhalodurans]QBR92343.1 penicillin acylase family protein [Nocardioides euryhalodurans]
MTSTDPAASPGHPATPVDPGWPERFRSLPAVVRLSLYVSLSLVAVLVLGLVTATVLVRQPFPETGGELELVGLDADVTVVRDDAGIPQLYGDSVDDLMRAQGFVHAQERFFEMDVRRHTTSGRLSELFGETTVEVDTFVRTLGWREVAEREIALLEPETRTAFEAYADGVNAYLDQTSTGELALEYSVLGLTGLDYEPEPWTTADSLAWLKAMAWDLRGNMTDEIDRVLALSENSPEQVADIFPEYDARRHRPIVTQGAVVDGVFDQAATGGTRLPTRPAYVASDQALDVLAAVRDRVDRLPAFLGKGDGIGSNSWVVSGDHSSTGQPLLANDPHLGVTMPGIWMQMGLHCRTVSADCPLDVSGFTFSGMPGVVIGHNADIAWGMTNLGPDVTDLYLEKVEGDRWRHDGRLRRLETREEVIEVRGGDDVEVTVRSTAHGPLVSDVSTPPYAEVGALADPDHGDPRPTDGYGVSLAWTALQPAPTADAIMALNTAGDWDEFREAASSFAVPSQNLVYADRDGHIGYQAPGRIPIRKSGNDGRVPAEGWRADDDWTGDFVPFQGLPNVLDPEEGFVVTANQQVIGGDYPYFLTDDWDRGYRAQRIRDLIEAEQDLSISEMSELQLDDRNPMAATLVPYLLDVELPDGYLSDGQELLADWDFGQPADSAAAAYYNVVWRNLLELTFHDDLPEEAWPDGGQRWMAAVEGLLREPDDAWWDDRTTEDDVETRDEILAEAQELAREELTRLHARNPESWRWGHLHRLDLEHQTLGQSDNPVVASLFNRGGWEVGGGGAIVDATSWDAREGYGVTAAPSMRMVVSLGDLDDSRWVNLTGVSGHPFHEHYTDQTDLFVDGETLPWPSSREAVEAAADDTLTLVPAEEEG